MTTLAGYFTLIVGMIKGHVFAYAGQGRPWSEMFFHLQRRLQRMTLRFERLYTQWKTGTLPKPRPARPRPANPRPPAPRQRYPNGYSWLFQMVRPTGIHGQQLLAQVVNDPEFPAFMAAAPQVGRILRPLARMLAFELPPELREKKRVRRPRPKAPKPPPEPPIQWRPPHIGKIPPIPAHLHLQIPLLKKSRRRG